VLGRGGAPPAASAAAKSALDEAEVRKNMCGDHMCTQKIRRYLQGHVWSIPPTRNPMLQ